MLTKGSKILLVIGALLAIFGTFFFIFNCMQMISLGLRPVIDLALFIDSIVIISGFIIAVAGLYISIEDEGQKFWLGLAIGGCVGGFVMYIQGFYSSLPISALTVFGLIFMIIGLSGFVIVLIKVKNHDS